MSVAGESRSGIIKSASIVSGGSNPIAAANCSNSETSILRSPPFLSARRTYRRRLEQKDSGGGWLVMTISRTNPSTPPVDHSAQQGSPPTDHDMELSLPSDAPRNIVRKRQQRKARSVAGRHIDEALSGLPISDQAKASRKAKLIDLPDDTPLKRRSEGVEAEPV